MYEDNLRIIASERAETITKAAIHMVKDEFLNIGAELTEHIESTGHSMEDTITFQDFYDLSEVFASELLRATSKCFIKVLTSVYTQQLVADEIASRDL